MDDDGVKLTTEKQIEYAEHISSIIGIPYPESDRKECRKFISAYSNLARLKEHCPLPLDILEWITDNLEGQKGLYAFLCRGEIIYIGKSKDLGSRIATSFNERIWHYDIDEIRYYPLENEADVNILEVMLIAKYKPVANTDCKSFDAPTLTTDINIYKEFQTIPLEPSMGKNILGKWWSTERNARKLLGLPITKELVYFPDDLHDMKISVKRFRIADVYMPSKTYSLEIELEDGMKERIMCNYLIEMQSPSFIKSQRKLRESE